jgi:hypothetical protein
MEQIVIIISRKKLTFEHSSCSQALKEFVCSKLVLMREKTTWKVVVDILFLTWTALGTSPSLMEISSWPSPALEASTAQKDYVSKNFGNLCQGPGLTAPRGIKSRGSKEVSSILTDQ